MVAKLDINEVESRCLDASSKTVEVEDVQKIDEEMALGGGSAQAARPVVSKPQVVKTRFFRAGDMVKTVDYGPATRSFEFADAHKPDGRVGRLEGLFCSVDMSDMAVWYRANTMSHYAAQPTEISYNGPEPWVYNVDMWSSASDNELESEGGRRSFEQRCERYWASGILYSEFLERREELKESRPHSKWEVLLDPVHITSSRNISLKRMVDESAGYIREELMSKLFPKRYRQWQNETGLL